MIFGQAACLEVGQASVIVWCVMTLVIRKTPSYGFIMKISGH